MLFHSLATISMHRAKLRCDVHLERIVMLLHERLQGGDDILEQLCNVESFQPELHGAGFEPGQIEQIIDEPRAGAGSRRESGAPRRQHSGAHQQQCPGLCAP